MIHEAFIVYHACQISNQLKTVSQLLKCYQMLYKMIERWTFVVNSILCSSYTIALSGVFELYARGRCLNHKAKPSGLIVPLEHAIQ